MTAPRTAEHQEAVEVATNNHAKLAALRAENQRLRLRLSECADELARLERHGDNVTRQIRADARAALKGAGWPAAAQQPPTKPFA